MKIRKQDPWGAGHFHAPRGKRTHNGIDIGCEVGQDIECINQGKVTKLGFAYEDDLSFRYVQITDDAGAKWRYFYVNPDVGLGEEVEAYSIIGTSQDLGKRYPEITQHFHLEILVDGKFIDPTGLVAVDA